MTKQSMRSKHLELLGCKLYRAIVNKYNLLYAENKELNSKLKLAISQAEFYREKYAKEINTK